MIYKFQSTLPARGATDFLRSHHAEPKDFNPRSPHGERLHADNSWACAGDFNPRSPHGERRPCAAHQAAYQHDFNPRSPHGERRKGSRWSRRALRHFNPRSPHGERRSAGGRFSHFPQDFNPRSPHGERQPSTIRAVDEGVFQSTLPARGATYGGND